MDCIPSVVVVVSAVPGVPEVPRIAGVVTELAELADSAVAMSIPEVTEVPEVPEVTEVTEVPAALSIVKDNASFLEFLRRMKRGNMHLKFPNVDGSFSVMLRNDPSSPECLALELIIIHDPGEDMEDEDDILFKAIDNEYDGYFCDENDDFYVMEGVYLRGDIPPNDPFVDAAIRKIDDLYHTVICGCGEHLIRDRAAVCTWCQLTSKPQELERTTCPICANDETPRKFLRPTKCCLQELCAKCEWKLEVCPYCREDLHT